MKYSCACLYLGLASIVGKVIVKQNKRNMSTQNAKEVFKKCGTCSQTFAHLLNREFGHRQEDAELAIDPLAGGIHNEGHQCGMLWGATLATGKEAYHRHPDPGEATATAVTATQQIVDSFVNRTNTVNCREIIGFNLKNVFLKDCSLYCIMVCSGQRFGPNYNLIEGCFFPIGRCE